MDYRKFATFIIGIGIAIVLVGGVRYVQYRPLPLPPVRQGLYQFGRTDRVDTELTNMERARLRAAVRRNIGVGVLVIVIGGGIFWAAKPSEEEQVKDDPDDPLARRRW